MMKAALQAAVERINARLAGLIENARRALRGESEFGVADVRQLREPVEEMAPIVAQSQNLQREHPEMAGQLDQYKRQLGELQTTLNQLRVMLLARQASLRADQTHVSAVSKWASTFHQTR